MSNPAKDGKLRVLAEVYLYILSWPETGQNEITCPEHNLEGSSGPAMGEAPAYEVEIVGGEAGKAWR